MIVEDYRELMAEAARAHSLNPSQIVQPTDHYIPGNGVPLHYLDWGNPHLPPLILLHGGGLTAHSWDMAALILRDRYHLIAPDFRGCGDSGRVEDIEEYGDQFVVEDIAALIRHLGLERFTLIGQSRGGMIGLQYADRFPDQLQSFVLVDITPEPNEVQVRPDGPRPWGNRDLETFASSEEAVQSVIARNSRSPEAYLRYITYHSIQQRPDGRWEWKEDRRRRPKATWMEPENRAVIRKALRRLAMPTLLIRGASSPSLSPEQAKRTVAAIPDGRLLVVPNSGHNVQTNNPGGFAEALQEFLDDQGIGIPESQQAAGG